MEIFEKLWIVMDELLADIKISLEDVIYKISEEITEALREITAGLQEIKEELKRETKSHPNELVITGIRYKRNEDLHEIFQAVGSVMGYSMTSIRKDWLLPTVDLFRIPGSDTSNRRIIVKFESNLEKERFLHRSYKHSAKLVLSAVGIKETGRFYIQQNLSRTHQQLKLEALRARKMGKLNRVRISDGNIYVQIRDGGLYVRINSENDIWSTVGEYTVLSDKIQSNKLHDDSGYADYIK